MPILPWLLPPVPATMVLFEIVILTVALLLASTLIVSVRFPRNVRFETVPVMFGFVAPVAALAKRKPILPEVMLLFWIVQFVRLKADNMPLLFSTRRLSSTAPLIVTPLTEPL